MSWKDWLNVEDVLNVVSVANVEVGIVLEGHADQISDGILRSLPQVVSLLGISCRTRNQHRGRGHRRS
jgi:hypothetical protein